MDCNYSRHRPWQGSEVGRGLGLVIRHSLARLQRRLGEHGITLCDTYLLVKNMLTTWQNIADVPMSIKVLKSD